MDSAKSSRIRQLSACSLLPPLELNLRTCFDLWRNPREAMLSNRYKPEWAYLLSSVRRCLDHTQKKHSDRELAGFVGQVRVVREFRTFSQRTLRPKKYPSCWKGVHTRPLRIIRQESYSRRTTCLASGTRTCTVPMDSG